MFRDARGPGVRSDRRTHAAAHWNAMHDPTRRGIRPRPSPPSFASRACLFLLALVAAVGSGPGCAPAYEERLAAYRAEGNLDRAAELIERAVAQAPDDPVILRE